MSMSIFFKKKIGSTEFYFFRFEATKVIINVESYLCLEATNVIMNETYISSTYVLINHKSTNVRQIDEYSIVWNGIGTPAT